MNPAVEVIVPWRAGCPHRERAWGWLEPRWSARYGWPATAATCPDGPWIKAAAVNPAAQRSTADVIVVADADVWNDQVDQAVAAVSAGASWAVPHGLVYRLNAHATRAALAGEGWQPNSLTERPYRGHPGGGIVVLSRSTLLDVPLDPRFVGWGQEDDSWADALTTLHGRPWRGTAPLWHLWHPPQPRKSRRHGSAEGIALRNRYRRAAGDPAAMAELLDEGRQTWPT